MSCRPLQGGWCSPVWGIEVAVGAILLGGGRGERLSGPDPKAFASLDGRTLLERAVTAVESCSRVEGFVVVAPEGWEARARSVVGPRPRLVEVVAGGGTRQDSVRRGLDALPEAFDVVICHDVARPVAPLTLFEAHRAAEADGFAGTDDAVLLERAGFRVAVVPGDPANIKITRPEDLPVASALVRG